MLTPNEASFHQRLILQCPARGMDLALQLRIPTLAESFPWMLLPHERQGANGNRALRCQVFDFIESANGSRPSIEDVERWCEDEAFLRCLSSRRRELLEGGTEDGRAIFDCPNCPTGFVIADLAALTLASHAPPPELLVEDNHHFAVPQLASAVRPRRREPGIRCSREIRFELPSVRLGLTTRFSGSDDGALLSVTEDSDLLREQAAWQRFAPIGQDPPEEHFDWTYESAGFRAVIRLLARLARFQNVGVSQLKPTNLLTAPVIDFYFLDALCYFTQSLDIQPTLWRTLRCPECSSAFYLAQ